MIVTTTIHFVFQMGTIQRGGKGGLRLVSTVTCSQHQPYAAIDLEGIMTKHHRVIYSVIHLVGR